MFSVMAWGGAVICGICFAKADSTTKWRSWLGLWAIVGLVALACGMLGVCMGSAS